MGHFADYLCEEAPLGAAIGGALPKSSFSASSFFATTEAFEGRLNGDSSWCAEETDNQYLEVDLGSVGWVCSLATQGYSFGSYWVTKYQISYSDDGINWLTVKEDGNKKVL